MAAATAVSLTKNAQAAFLEYYRAVQATTTINRNQDRGRLERIDRAYQSQNDRTEENLRAERANRQGDATRYQNITVPVVMPQVEAAVTHQASVYLSGYPLFGVVSTPEFIDQAVQLESIIDDQSIRGGWTRQLTMFFRDGYKYNFSALEVSWDNEVTYAVETNLAIDKDRGLPKEVIWSGNKLKRLDPYNTFVDKTVAPSEVYRKGEYAGFTEWMTRIELKAFISRLPSKIIGNITPAFESGLGGTRNSQDAGSMNYYIPLINPLIDEVSNTHGGTNWLRWAGLSNTRNMNIDYKDNYEVTTLYAKVLPSEFEQKVPNSNTPQIYKLILVNHEWIIFAELQTNAHAYIPILIGQPLEDGLDYQTKSLADNGLPFQELSTAYMASIIASRRRAISDRTLYDPSRITSSAINSANPSAKIPVRPSAYGKTISEAVYAFPYREDQQAAGMQNIQVLLGMANQQVGQNRTDQGQFTKGNRTLHEFESVMQNANGRDMLASILLEAQVFTPLKLILKTNILQFQAGVTVYNRDRELSVTIDPIALRRAILEFKVSDGLIPTDKLINAETLTVALQTIASSDKIAAGYNIAPMFSYFMKTQGAKITEFEKSAEQIAYEQAASQHSQLVALALEKGVNLEDIGPAPLPADFGYDPAANTPQPPQPGGTTTPQTPQAGAQ